MGAKHNGVFYSPENQSKEDMMSNTVMPEHRESDELCNQVDVDRLRLTGENAPICVLRRSTGPTDRG